MIRVASQLTFCSPTQIRRRMVVEEDEHYRVMRLFSLDENQIESANTLFFDGILSAEIVSLKEVISPDEITKLIPEYNYIDVTAHQSTNNLNPNEKPLLLDFGSCLPEKINNQLTRIAPTLRAFSIFEIIAACTYYPALLLNQPATLTIGITTNLLLWEGVDLVNKNITKRIQIRELK